MTVCHIKDVYERLCPYIFTIVYEIVPSYTSLVIYLTLGKDLYSRLLYKSLLWGLNY